MGASMVASSQIKIKPKFFDAGNNNVLEPITNLNHKHNKKTCARKMLQQL
jgi:hypothetical protein